MESMFINEVENIVGLSKKSIRYYEENGLLNPKRDIKNDYRIFTEEDIEKLKKIKFLRELDVPIREIKLLNDGILTLEECMKDRIKKIEEIEINLTKVKDMCLEIKESHDNFTDININNYFKEMRILNKREAFTMHKENNNKNKKIMGAIFSTVIFDAIFIILIGLLIYFEFFTESKMNSLIFIISLIILLIPVIATVVNLIGRIKEINGGEEDEALKY